MKRIDPFVGLSMAASALILAFIVLPLAEMILQPSLDRLIETIQDQDVRRSIWLSVYTSGLAAVVSFILGTPLAYLLARRNFKGKKLIESLIDLPIMIPHPVVGIAILSMAGRNHWLGQYLHQFGFRIMGSVLGIVVVLTFVGIPFYINTVKNGLEAIPVRLEKVSRSLGANMASTFWRVVLPLGFRSMLVGMIMCLARAISEFGAIVIVAYHPMIAPVMLYERFTAYGLEYSQPVAVWLIFVCLMLFMLLRLVSQPSGRQS